MQVTTVCKTPCKTVLKTKGRRVANLRGAPSLSVGLGRQGGMHTGAGPRGEPMTQMPQSTTSTPSMGMTIALEPQGNTVDIRRDEVFARWHHRTGGGLRCVVCDQEVHAYKPPSGTRWVRHNGGVDEHDFSKDQAHLETYQHAVLKTWVRDGLHDAGWQAKCEVTLPRGGKPDVCATRGADRIAVEIQLSQCTEADAKARNDRIKKDGYRVLWLTRPATWEAHLPAAGLAFDSEPGRYSSTEIGGLLYYIGEGRLDTNHQQRILLGGRRRPPLNTFLKDFANQALLWMPHREDASGWATVPQWREHLTALAGQVATSERDTAAKTKALAAAQYQQQLLTEQLATSRAQCATLERLYAEQLAASKAEYETLERQAGAQISDLQRDLTAAQQRVQHSRTYVARLESLVPRWRRRQLRRGAG